MDLCDITSLCSILISRKEYSVKDLNPKSKKKIGMIRLDLTGESGCDASFARKRGFNSD